MQQAPSHTSPLQEGDEPPARDPIAWFRTAWQRAARTEPLGAAVFVLATVDERGHPAARALLLKEVDEQGGFVFYTNLLSPKARQLRAHPHAAMCFYWASVRQQVRLDGAVEPLEPGHADRYFATRPRGSQLAAWVSRQSEPIASRQALEQALREAEARFAGRPVPRPPHWGGFRLLPRRIELWFERPHRLHDRWLYERNGDGAWRCWRLQP